MTAATAIALNHLDRPALQRRQSLNNLVRIKADGLGTASLHSSFTPSVRDQISDGERAVTNATQTRTIVDRAPIDSIDERTFARIVSNALQAHYGPMKASAKCIANDAGASIQSAKNWLSGLCPPSSIYLKRLERKVPGLAAEMRRLQALEADHNPDFQRQFSEFVRMVQKNFTAETAGV